MGKGIYVYACIYIYLKINDLYLCKYNSTFIYCMFFSSTELMALLRKEGGIKIGKEGEKEGLPPFYR